jgi:hypothetical protein
MPIVFADADAASIVRPILVPRSPSNVDFAIVARVMDLDIEATKARLASLRSEHRDLDEVIARLADKAPFDQLQLKRLKKRKLVLKDLITRLESQLLPDIIA